MVAPRVAVVTQTEQLDLMCVHLDTGDTWVATTLPAGDVTGNAANQLQPVCDAL